MAVRNDNSHTNFTVKNTLTCNGRIVSPHAIIGNLNVPGGSAGDFLMNDGFGNATWSLSPISSSVINVGVTPTGMAITSDGKLGYVANNNNYAVTTGNYVSVIDLTTNFPLTNISSDGFNQPYTATINPDDSLVYITNSAGTTVSVISTSSNSIVATITGFDGPSGMAIKGTTGYVNNYGASSGLGSGNGHSISIVNLVTNTITGTINVNQAPSALTLSPDQTKLYVINYVTGTVGSGTLQVISTTSNTVLSTLSGFSGPFAIVIHPDGVYAYITNFGSNNFDPYGTTVSVVNLSSNTIMDTIEVGIQPSGAAITPNGRYVYVSMYNTLYAGAGFTNLTPGQGTVNVIDTTTNTLLPLTITVGQSPSNIVISPDGLKVYVSNFISNTLSVLEALQ